MVAGYHPAMTRYVLLLFLSLGIMGSLSTTPVTAQPCIPAGDVNLDQHHTPRDALWALQSFLGLRELSPEAQCQANVDLRNAEITPADVLCITHAFLGLPSCLSPLSVMLPDTFVARTPAEAFPEVILDGSATSSPGGLALTYRWRFITVPPASAATNIILSDPDAAVTRFTPDVVGLYQLQFTATDALGRSTSDTALVNAQEPDDMEPLSTIIDPRPGEMVTIMFRVTDSNNTPVPCWPIQNRVMQGDGSFIVAAEETLARCAETLSAVTGGNPQPIDTPTVTVLTNADGIATANYRIGQEARQIIVGVAEALPNDPEVIVITLGPLAGNGVRPVNLAVGGGRGYTANGNNTVSVFNTAEAPTGQFADVLAAIDLTQVLSTDFGNGSVIGVAVEAARQRLYIYALVSTSQGEAIVVLTADTVTTQLLEPLDLDDDGVPGRTVFMTPTPTPTAPLVRSPGQLLQAGFGNLLTLDSARQQLYVVLPGVVTFDDSEARNILEIRPGEVVILDIANDDLEEVGRVVVGEVPTGIAVNPRTNRLYIANRGFHTGPDNTTVDSLTVVDSVSLQVTVTLPVGHTPLGVTVDITHNLVYVATVDGDDPTNTQVCCGSVSVINGATDMVLQTVHTGGASSVAVLVGAETTFLDDRFDRVYVNDADGTVLNCDVTALSAPEPCQHTMALPSLEGQLAFNDAQTRLYGARLFDSSVGVLNVTNNTRLADIQTGVVIRGLTSDAATGTIYVSDFDGNDLLVIASNGALTRVDLHDLGFFRPGQIIVDEAHNRLYVLAPNGTDPLLLALDRTTLERLALLELDDPQTSPFGSPLLLAIDANRNLLYISTESNHVVVLDGHRFNGRTPESTVRLATVPLGEDEAEQAQAVVIDSARNLIYVTRAHATVHERNALVVLRGADIDPASRMLLSPPTILAEIAVPVGFQGDRRSLVFDAQRNLLYVAGAPGCLFGTVEEENCLGGGEVDLTVLDGFRIVDAEAQVSANPDAAILGQVSLKVPSLAEDIHEPALPLMGMYGVEEVALHPTEGLLYVVLRSSAPFEEGFLAILNSALVLDAERNLVTAPNDEIMGAHTALLTIMPIGIEPSLLDVDTERNRVIVSNQSLGALSILRGLEAR